MPKKNQKSVKCAYNNGVTNQNAKHKIVNKSGATVHSKILGGNMEFHRRLAKDREISGQYFGTPHFTFVHPADDKRTMSGGFNLVETKLGVLVCEGNSVNQVKYL